MLTEKEERRYYNKWMNSMRRGIEFKLTQKQFKDLISKTRCAYSGVKFLNSGANNSRYPTFERLDESKGYEVGNVVMVCKYFNHLRELSKNWEVTKVRVREGEVIKSAKKIRRVK